MWPFILVVKMSAAGAGWTCSERRPANMFPGMRTVLLVSSFCALHAGRLVSQTEPSIIPRPTSLVVGPGAFTVTARTIIAADRADSLAARRLARDLAPATMPTASP